MEYHPGGEEELMKAAGADGTELFDQVKAESDYNHYKEKSVTLKFNSMTCVEKNNCLNCSDLNFWNLGECLQVRALYFVCFWNFSNFKDDISDKRLWLISNINI